MFAVFLVWIWASCTATEKRRGPEVRAVAPNERAELVIFILHAVCEYEYRGRYIIYIYIEREVLRYIERY